MSVKRLFAFGASMVAFGAVAHAAPPPAVFARCAVCHNAEKGAPAKIGPNLWGIYGKKAASGTFNYSAALKSAKLTWNDETLDKWLTGPMQMVPGTLMSFPGLKDPAKRAELIAWLKTQH
jgi:cytochrome c